MNDNRPLSTTSGNSAVDEKLSPKQAAELVGHSIYCLWNWRKRKLGPPYIREVGRIYYLKSDIEAWQKASRWA